MTASTISSSDNLIGFQGDFTFDSAIIGFQAPAVSAAGLTTSNWTVSANVLNSGPGTMKTLRISAFANDQVTALSGSGVLLNLNMTRVSNNPGDSTPLVWAASPNDFEFYDTDVNVQLPNNTPLGSITIVAPPTPTPTPSPTPTASPTPTPTPTPAFHTISGTVTYCLDSNPVPGVNVNIAGDTVTSGTSDGSGNYSVTVPIGGNYVATPTHTPRPPGSAGISTVDVIATQQHFLQVAPLTGCALTAANVDESTSINTFDVIAIQRFFLGQTFGTANVGKYRFTPVTRTYTGVTSDQTEQDYSTVILGDVVASFVHRPGAPTTDAATAPATEDRNVIGAPGAVQAVSLPNTSADSSRSELTLPVTTTAIDKATKLVGFEGDFTFDERVITFQDNPVQNAGLTADDNWVVVGNVLPGRGPIRTVRVSAYSSDLSPLEGTGTFFELRAASLNGSTQLIWAEGLHQFMFIDSNLKMRAPDYSASGRVISDGATEKSVPAPEPEVSSSDDAETESAMTEDGTSTSR